MRNAFAVCVQPCNIYVPPIGANTFTHVTTPDNREDNVIYIDHPESNGDPNVIVLFTPNWNPRGLPGTYSDHATGIWYAEGRHKASIYNEDGYLMPYGAAFNVHIPDDDAIAFIHTATDENRSFDYALLDRPSLNSNPYSRAYVTHNWNPGGGLGGILHEQALGVWYEDDMQQWGMFSQEETVLMPVGLHFSVLVIPEYRGFLPLAWR